MSRDNSPPTDSPPVRPDLYRRSLPNGLVVAAMAPEHAGQLELLQIECYPTLADNQRLKARHYLKHIELFPQGQFVVLDGNKVVGMTTSMIVGEKEIHGPHTFDEFFAGGWLTPHNPAGDWLYGIDVGTAASHRGRGVARALYVARQDTVRRLGLKGQCTVGMLSGYGAVSGKIPAEEYYRQLANGEIKDPTVSAQLKIGFKLDELIANYLDDPLCAGYGARLILPADKKIADSPDQYR